MLENRREISLLITPRHERGEGRRSKSLAPSLGFPVIFAVAFLIADASSATVKSSAPELFSYSSLETGVGIYIDLKQRREDPGSGLAVLLRPTTASRQAEENGSDLAR